MRKYKLIYLIIPLIILYSIINNNYGKSFNIKNNKYFGQKILRATEYLTLFMNDDRDTFEDTLFFDIYRIIEPDTNNAPNTDEYRYIGPFAKNYIYFNCTSSDTSSCELWRIVGIFNVENEYGKYKLKIKIMKNDSIGKMSFDGNSNIFLNSNIEKYLNENYYNSLSSSAKNMIATSMFYTGGEEKYNYNAIDFYQSERNNNHNKETLYLGKIGLIYPSDYLFTYYRVDDNCFNNLGYCENKNNSWMSEMAKEQLWTMTPVGNTNSLYTISTNSNIDRNNPSEQLDVYPTLYLDSDTIIEDGDGTYSNPYKIRKIEKSEIQSESDMDINGLDKSDVNVDDTLSNKSIIFIVISAILVICGSIILIKMYINKKKIFKDRR